MGLFNHQSIISEGQKKSAFCSEGLSDTSTKGLIRPTNKDYFFRAEAEPIQLSLVKYWPIMGL